MRDFIFKHVNEIKFVYNFHSYGNMYVTPSAPSLATCYRTLTPCNSLFSKRSSMRDTLLTG